MGTRVGSSLVKRANRGKQELQEWPPAARNFPASTRTRMNSTAAKLTFAPHNPLGINSRPPTTSRRRLLCRHYIILSHVVNTCIEMLYVFELSPYAARSCAHGLCSRGRGGISSQQPARGRKCLYGKGLRIGGARACQKPFSATPRKFFWERRLAHRRGSVRIEFTRSVMRQSSSCDAADQRQVHYPPRRGLPAADERAGRRLGRIRAGASVRRWRRRFDPPLIKPERSVPCLQVGYPATVREGGAAERRLRWKSGAARNVAEHIKK